jgi:hypothetical protein
MFSSYSEAFANPIKSQLDELNREAEYLIKKQKLINSVESNRDKFGLETPNYFLEPDNKLEIGETDRSYPDGDSFFDTQGGYSMSDLPNNENDNLSSLIDTGSTVTFKTKELSLGSSLINDTQYNEEEDEIDSVFSEPTKKQKKTYYTHDYYISSFLDGIYNNRKGQSKVYQHVSNCNYCKTVIKQKMSGLNQPSQQTVSPSSTSLSPSLSPPSPPENKPSTPIVISDDVKDILIVVIVGIVLIFILDLFIKIRRKF